MPGRSGTMLPRLAAAARRASARRPRATGGRLELPRTSRLSRARGRHGNARPRRGVSGGGDGANGARLEERRGGLEPLVHGGSRAGFGGRLGGGHRHGPLLVGHGLPADIGVLVVGGEARRARGTRAGGAEQRGGLVLGGRGAQQHRRLVRGREDRLVRAQGLRLVVFREVSRHGPSSVAFTPHRSGAAGHSRVSHVHSRMRKISRTMVLLASH
ncbi:hypothetical protein B5F23_07800 [Olsenella sp. An188]|nr:hypothetical protein B5F23_07800 [Olsenella sp. An188]